MKWFCAFMLLVLCTSYAAQAAPKRSVVLASQKTKYKAALLPKVEALIEERDCEVTTVEMGALADAISDDVALVVVLVAAPEWRKGPFNAFMKGTTAELRKKMLVVTTAKRMTWKTPLKDVHGITGASKKATTEATLEQVAETLDELLGEAE